MRSNVFKFRRVHLPLPRLLWRMFFAVAYLTAMWSWMWLVVKWYTTGQYVVQMLLVSAGITALAAVICFTKDKSKIW